MRNAIWLLLGPAICLGVLVLTTLIVVFAMRRNTRTVQDALERQEKSGEEPIRARSADTRWARGDLKSPEQPTRREPRMVSCPECGGENPPGASTCAYCGREL